MSMLKPLPLTSEHTPTELRAWIDAFEAYYEASSMHLHPRGAQLAYMWNCVERGLATRLQECVKGDMPVRGNQGSCIAAIRKYFDIRYPLILRRMDYFQSAQVEGERWSDYLARKNGLADEADATGLTDVQHRVFRALVGTRWSS